MRIIVVGAGIGGLTTALSLHQAGIEVDVYEAVPELKPLGVGINILPHAARELTELGLGERLAERAIATEALVYTNRYGQEIWREPRGMLAGYKWPQYSVHRGALQMLLYEAAVARLGADHVHTDAAAVGVETSEHSAEVTFQSRSGQRRTERADVVVAADGIHSALRAQFYPNEGAPKWCRRILWRGMTESTPFWGGRTMIMSGFQDQKFVCYPISPEAATRGKSLINWIAELHFPESDDFRREDWNRTGALTDFLPRFEDWRFEFLDIPDLIRRAPVVFEYPLVDRDPVESWTFGRVTLLGDAAHPMYPIGSNGASQAILDARTLAFELATQSDIDSALQRYQAARLPPTSKIVLANRKNGPEQVMQLAHERAPSGFNVVHDVISAAELDQVHKNYKQLAGFDCETLNTRPSLTPPRRG
ncbi:MAG TPA: flavin-dependent oxidoreductase [Polyangiales bacterium]|nr:flavin-dependent oxidoreductase [Polyangiales bacterium]